MRSSPDTDPDHSLPPDLSRAPAVLAGRSIGAPSSSSPPPGPSTSPSSEPSTSATSEPSTSSSSEPSPSAEPDQDTGTQDGDQQDGEPGREPGEPPPGQVRTDQSGSDEDLSLLTPSE